uniref:Uncharacterized protein n=1 Tax=Anguilla anguilla TaxID=7936 RepID=A0A0E9SBK3_ANGAN
MPEISNAEILTEFLSRVSLAEWQLLCKQNTNTSTIPGLCL